MVVEAIRRADEPTRAGVLDAFLAMGPYHGITGLVRFDDTGERLDAPVSFYRVEMVDGERVMAYQGLTTDLV